jgi:hypothetical protein
VKYWEVRLENTFVTGKTETLEYYISSQGKKHYFNTKIVPELADGEVISVRNYSAWEKQYRQPTCLRLNRQNSGNSFS